jgi:hypothetical protein
VKRVVCQSRREAEYLIEPANHSVVHFKESLRRCVDVLIALLGKFGESLELLVRLFDRLWRDPPALDRGRRLRFARTLGLGEARLPIGHLAPELNQRGVPVQFLFALRGAHHLKDLIEIGAHLGQGVIVASVAHRGFLNDHSKFAAVPKSSIDTLGDELTCTGLILRGGKGISLGF